MNLHGYNKLQFGAKIALSHSEVHIIRLAQFGIGSFFIGLIHPYPVNRKGVHQLVFFRFLPAQFPSTRFFPQADTSSRLATRPLLRLHLRG